MISTVAFLVFCGVTCALGAVGLALRAHRLHSRVAIDRRLGRAAVIARTGSGSSGDVGGEAGAESVRGRAFLASTVGFLLGVMLGSPFVGLVLGGMAACGVAYWAQHQRTARIRACEKEMPRALEVMNMGLRAGRSLPAALGVAAEESAEPLCSELERVVSEAEMGRPIGEALTDFAERLTGCATAQHFAVAALVLQESGGNLISVIEKLTADARARSGYRQRLKALTSEGRSSAMFLAALPLVFAVLGMLTNSSYSKTLIEDPSGRVLTVVALGWWFCGVLLLRRLLRPLSK